MGDKQITVFLADDHKVLREGLTMMLASDPMLSVVGESGDGLEVLQRVHDLRPDVVIMDITLPGLNGLALCSAITRELPDTAVIMLTMHNNEDFVVEALEGGASGYLIKDTASSQIINAIHAVSRGEAFLGPGITRNVLSRLNKDDADPFKQLTAREQQVLQLIAEGKTNRQIGEVLDITHKTVDTHRASLMRKLDIHSQTGLVKYALRKGVISLE